MTMHLVFLSLLYYMSITLANLALGGMFLYGITEPATKKKAAPVDIYRKRDMHGLSTDTQDIIRLITFSDSIDPVGSFKYKAHKYPGDIDIFEPVKICCTKATATSKIVAELQQIARKVKQSKTVFWGDFKAGLDLILKPQIDQSIEAYSQRTGINPLGQNYPESTREHYIVRWTEDDVLLGSKKLKSGTELSLEEAITHDTLVKLDLWAPVEGNYTEVTNFFLFVMQDQDGVEQVLNAQLGDRMASLNHDIEKYGSKEHWNPLKLAKRLWNRALYTKDFRLTDRLYPLFSSGAAQLNQVAGESETLRFMFRDLTSAELTNVRQKLINQISGFKRRINDVNDIDLDTDEDELYRLLDLAIAGDGNEDTIGALLQSEKIIKAIVSAYSEQFLKTIGIVNR